MSEVIRTIDLRGKSFSLAQLRALAPRAALSLSEAMVQVQPIVEGVRARGLVEVIKSAEQFDGVNPEPIRVSNQEIDFAIANLDSDLRAAIEESIARVRTVSESSLPVPSAAVLGEGATVSQRWVAVDSVGLYVPGGKAVYPSSVIMNVVPAQVAGVRKLIIATPGQKQFAGRPHPTVLATAGLLGVREILTIGGPSAIASFAYGLPEIGLEPVDLVTGPGNVYVAAAKRLLRGEIGIDSEAGTTEILVLADETANAKLIAYDLVSQAEHDSAAAAVLVTNSSALIAAVEEQLRLLSLQATHSERILQALGGQQSALILTENLEQSIAFANAYAAEHLEIMTANNEATVASVVNAGAIFVGANSPVSLGDYMAGSNHVLPTGGTARFSAGLGVATFMRAQQIVEYSESALASIGAQIMRFAEAEGLPAHAQAVAARVQKSAE